MRVGIVMFDKFLTSEVTAPIEVFSKARRKGPIPFEVVTVAPEKRIITSEEGAKLQPDFDLDSCPALDILVVPSSLDMEPHLANEKLVSFVRKRAAEAKWVASHCAGAFLLGKLGILDNRQATTYIGGTDDLKKACPLAKVVDTEYVVVDGNLITSAGGLISYDASLVLVEKIGGSELADKVANALSYFPWLERKTKIASS